jgi:hypothetical protein
MLKRVASRRPTTCAAAQAEARRRCHRSKARGDVNGAAGGHALPAPGGSDRVGLQPNRRPDPLWVSARFIGDLRYVVNYERRRTSDRPSRGIALQTQHIVFSLYFPPWSLVGLRWPGRSCFIPRTLAKRNLAIILHQIQHVMLYSHDLNVILSENRSRRRSHHAIVNRTGTKCYRNDRSARTHPGRNTRLLLVPADDEDTPASFWSHRSLSEQELAIADIRLFDIVVGDSIEEVAEFLCRSGTLHPPR